MYNIIISQFRENRYWIDIKMMNTEEKIVHAFCISREKNNEYSLNHFFNAIFWIDFVQQENFPSKDWKCLCSYIVNDKSAINIVKTLKDIPDKVEKYLSILLKNIQNLEKFIKYNFPNGKYMGIL